MIDVKPDSEATCLLLERIESGEQEAIESLLTRYRPRLRQLVNSWSSSRLRARVDASDVVQETQLEAFRRLGDFLKRRPMPFRLWLRKTFEERMRMVERVHVVAARRSVNRETLLPNGAGGITSLVAAVDPSPSQQFAQGELAGRVRHALAQLADLDRDILIMRTFDGLSYAEVSLVLEIDVATARKRHGRALVRLHRFLVENGLTESQL